MKVLLDANALMIPGKFRVDIFSELEKFGKPQLYTLDLVMEELQRLTRGRGKVAGYARLALKLVKMKRIKILKAVGKNTDENILRIAKSGFVVCTQDVDLIKKLKRDGVVVISLRQKKFLEMR